MTQLTHEMLKASTVTAVFAHVVKKDDQTGEWEIVYFADRAKADTFPTERTCRSAEPSLLVAVRHPETERYYSMRTGKELHVT